MATLLGPHLLDDLTGHFEYEENGVTKVRTEQSQLLDWQPPVCLVLINTLNREELAPKKTQAETETEEDCLDRLIDDTRTEISDLKDHIELKIAPVTTPIKFIADHSQLRGTKVIGRIFLDDARVKAQIMADPEKAARFHHRLVLAARAKLNDIQANLANRVDYWVVVNEVLGNSASELEMLGQYEKKRMELAEGPASEDTLYGCGLYALANANPDDLELWNAKGNYGMATVLTKANAHNQDNENVPHHVLLLHQYFQPDNEEFENHERSPGVDADGYLLAANLRDNVRRFEHHYLKDFQYGNLKVIISEYGLDGRIGLPENQLHASRGWKHFDQWSGTTVPQSGGTPYLQTLKALDRANRGYGVDSDVNSGVDNGVILGYCIYGWGYNCNYEFWSYPLDATPDPHPDCGPVPTGVSQTDKDYANPRRGATMTDGLVNYAESLRAQTLPPQLRLHFDGNGLNMREGPGTAYDRICTIPAGDTS